MEYICTLCGEPESSCKCERFCTLCRSNYDVRLCEDGCYYCPDCREACGYTAQESYQK